MMNELVQTIMTRNPVSIDAKETLAQAMTMIVRRQVNHLPVLQDGKFVGLISSYEINARHSESQDPSSVTIADIMQKKVVKITPEDKIGTAAELLLDRRFQVLPVVDDDRLVGIITSYDVLKYEFKKEYKNPILYQEVLEIGYRAAM